MLPAWTEALPRFQLIALGDLGLARLGAMQRAAFGQQVRPRSAMDRAVHAATAQQALVRRIDDGISIERGDVADHDIKPDMSRFGSEEWRWFSHDPSSSDLILNGAKQRSSR